MAAWNSNTRKMKTEDPWNESSNQTSPSVGSGFKRGTPTPCIRQSKAGKDFCHPLWVFTYVLHVPTHGNTIYTHGHDRKEERQKRERREGGRDKGTEGRRRCITRKSSNSFRI